MHKLETAYAIFEVSDVDANATFFRDVIGLAPCPDVAGDKRFTNDQAAHRITLTQGPRNDLAVYGVEATSLEAFDETVARIQSLGYDVVEDPDLAALREVERLARVDAPWGRPLELVFGLHRSELSPATPLVPGGFLTKDQGFGHVVVVTLNYAESLRFLEEGLGFTQSDWIETEIMEGINLTVRFYHCNARHHSFAIAEAPFELPTVAHHVMLETNDRDDVGAAFDRVWNTTLGIANGLGLHDNDKMFSFYVISPAGFQVEVGYGARTITAPWTENRMYTKISVWGHQPLRMPA